MRVGLCSRAWESSENRLVVITRGSVAFGEDQRGTPNSRSTSSRPGPDIVRNLLRRSSGLISSPIQPFEIMSVTCVEIVDRGIPKVLERLVTLISSPKAVLVTISAIIRSSFKVVVPGRHWQNDSMTAHLSARDTSGCRTFSIRDPSLTFTGWTASYAPEWRCPPANLTRCSNAPKTMET